MKTNHKTHSKTVFLPVLLLILLFAILLPIGATYGKYSTTLEEITFGDTIELSFEIVEDPANPDGPGIEEQTPTTVYQVQPGDTLASIAEKYGITVESLAAYNGMASDAVISPGTILHIPPKN